MARQESCLSLFAAYRVELTRLGASHCDLSQMQARCFEVLESFRFEEWAGLGLPVAGNTGYYLMAAGGAQGMFQLGVHCVFREVELKWIPHL